jgi:glutathione S-transferase
MLKLYGFAQSGNTFKVAFLLRALGVPWQPVAMSFADFAGGKTRDPAWREGVNEMGEVPVLEDDRGRKITQSGVILTMLAAKHGKLGGKDDDERLEVLRWLFFDNHKFTNFFATWRFMKSFAAAAPDPAIAAFLVGGSTAPSASSRSTWPAARSWSATRSRSPTSRSRATSSSRPRRAATSSSSASRTSPPGAIG